VKVAIAERPAHIVDVAVAVITRPDGYVLLAKRPGGKPYAGYWEFPGGKIEAGESAHDGLVRELQEELGIHVEQAYPWITQIFDYPHATVRLRFYRVVAWTGEPHPHEGQELSWQHPASVVVTPMLPANGPVLKALNLPPLYAISNAAELGTEDFLLRLESALNNGLRLFQLREKLPSGELPALAAAALNIARCHGARMVLNADVELAIKLGAHGVQLNARQLMELHAKPDLELVGASCHNAEELARAKELELDFVLLSPVLPTQSHPGAETLGWEKFDALIKELPMPVYALGGLKVTDMESAWRCGAHGVALLRAAWQ
jgi:8-oxo-dGTP diphosphatase